MRRSLQSKERTAAVTRIGLREKVEFGCGLSRYERRGEIGDFDASFNDSAILTGSPWGWSGFYHPAAHDPPQLVMLEPYQPGGIPVVFVHGLLSRPGTWREMIDGLRADPEMRDCCDSASKSVPTSLDHISPKNPFIEAAGKLRFAEGVWSHSIIGTGRCVLNGKSGDGVVLASSARLDAVDSEMLIPASHGRIHRHDRTIKEVRRILSLHLHDYDFELFKSPVMRIRPSSAVLSNFGERPVEQRPREKNSTSRLALSFASSRQ